MKSPQAPSFIPLHGCRYHQRFASTAYFKSTDGHCGQWDLSLRRLNLHLIDLLAAHGACILVDTTRKGRTFPDSFNRTVPIWAACINRAVSRLRAGEAAGTRRPEAPGQPGSAKRCSSQCNCGESVADTLSSSATGIDVDVSVNLPTAATSSTLNATNAEALWDTELHTPETVSDSEHAAISASLDRLVDKLLSSGVRVRLTRLKNCRSDARLQRLLVRWAVCAWQASPQQVAGLVRGSSIS